MQLSVSKAEEIVEQYANALSRQIPDSGIARPESWLPCPPDVVVQAIKISCALDILSKTMTPDIRNGFGTAISSLSSFVPDAKATMINKTATWSIDEKFEKRDSQEFLELEAFRGRSAYGFKLRCDLENYIDQVAQLDLQDPQYFQRAYALAGVEYSTPAKKRSFWRIFSGVA